MPPSRTGSNGTRNMPMPAAAGKFRPPSAQRSGRRGRLNAPCFPAIRFDGSDRWRAVSFVVARAHPSLFGAQATVAVPKHEGAPLVRPRFRGFVSDMDGIVADTDELHYLGWKDFLAPLGIDLPAAEWAKGVGLGEI